MAALDAHAVPAVGGQVEVDVELAALHLFDAASERRLVA